MTTKASAMESTVRTSGGSRRARKRPVSMSDLPDQAAELEKAAKLLREFHKKTKTAKLKELDADGVLSAWEDTRENMWLYYRRLYSAFADHPEVPPELI